MSRRHLRREHAGAEFELLVRDEGPPDGPVALLLHGFPQHGGLWQGCLPGLHELGLRTLAPDQRGYSPQPQPRDVEAYRLGPLVADALAVLDDVGAQRAVVVGHDWGALVGWALAAHHPERVRGLVALSVPHPHAFGRAIREDAEQQQLSDYFGLLRKEGTAERVLLGDDAAALRRFFEGGSLTADAVQDYLAPMLSEDGLRGPLSWYRAMAGPELAAVPRISVPTVYVSAEHDLGVGRAAAQWCADYVDGPYRRVDLSGTHWIVDEEPDVVVRAVASLL
ncbi:alpha/beta fold hydrolase [Angustibacter sp. McL0619]|uniref:alpha/beta fold hydrolase n=1 Tax=Angustibacter sp. McL0619 TaxID=3415676 RepID=UPI003CE8EABB